MIESLLCELGLLRVVQWWKRVRKRHELRKEREFLYCCARLSYYPEVTRRYLDKIRVIDEELARL